MSKIHGKKVYIRVPIPESKKDFATACLIDSNITINQFAADAFLKALDNLKKKNDFDLKILIADEVDEKVRNRIKKLIVWKFGSIRKFCKDFEYNFSHVCAILRGSTKGSTKIWTRIARCSNYFLYFNQKIDDKESIKRRLKVLGVGEDFINDILKGEEGEEDKKSEPQKDLQNVKDFGEFIRLKRLEKTDG